LTRTCDIAPSTRRTRPTVWITVVVTPRLE
jgi:hypothetical protein